MARISSCLDCFAVTLSAVLLAGCRSTPNVPDVILITIDTLRADHVGSYGDARAATPVLDALARTGTRFAHVVAPVPLTLPSHASVMTGLTPLAHGLHDNTGFVLAKSIPTMAERFQQSGFETAAFVSGAPLDHQFGLDRGFDRYDDRMTRGGDAARPAAIERRADETVAAVDAWLQRDPSAHRRPLFLWIHVFDPHAPYEAPEPFTSRFRDRPYDGEVAFVDTQIGTLLDRVKRARPDRRALVATTADHGEGLGDHDEPTHGLFVYDSTIRVPLIVSGPGVPSSVVVERMARLIDVAPTLLDLAGVPPLDRADGASLRSSMTGGAAAAPDPAYVESRFGRLCCGWAPVHAWRDGRWMLIDLPKVELYDLSADPGERHNLAAGEPGQTSRLQRALAQALARESAAPLHAASADAAERLRSLGYASATDTRKPSLRDPKDMIGVSVRLGRAIDIEDADPAGAARELEAVLRADPENPLARRHVGLLIDRLIDRGDFGEARARLAALVARDPSDTVAAFKLGVVSARLDDLERAISLFRIVVAREPANADALADLGGALLKRGRAAEAATYFERAIATDHASVLSWNGLAYSRLATGDKGGAADAMRESLRLQPDQADIRGALEKLER